MRYQMLEINEAINAGYDVVNNVDDILKKLDDAKIWGIFDMISKRSILSGYMKHSKLDEAQNKLNQLKISVQRFNSELNDVKVYCDVNNINYDSCMKVLDIVFDNIFVDIYALSKISDSKKQIENLKYEVKNVVDQLERNII